MDNRRNFLKGLAGVAGLVSLPKVLKGQDIEKNLNDLKKAEGDLNKGFERARTFPVYVEIEKKLDAETARVTRMHEQCRFHKSSGSTKEQTANDDQIIEGIDKGIAEAEYEMEKLDNISLLHDEATKLESFFNYINEHILPLIENITNDLESINDKSRPEYIEAVQKVFKFHGINFLERCIS